MSAGDLDYAAAHAEVRDDLRAAHLMVLVRFASAANTPWQKVSGSP